MSAVLRRRSQGTGAVDPHWDFERGGGAPYDASGRRFERIRARIPGSEPAEVRVRLARRDEGGDVELPPAEHLCRFLGGAQGAAESWAPVMSPAFVAPPPLVVLALDLSGLGPGEHVLTTSAPGREPEEHRITIARRPFHTFPAPPPGAARSDEPVVRSATGLGRVQVNGEARPATAHVWRVVRHGWAAKGKLTGGYRVEATIDLVAVTLFDGGYLPERTRFRELGESAAAEVLRGFDAGTFEAWRAPEAHADEALGYGLPFPTLVGLPSQPRPDGAHPRRA